MTKLARKLLSLRFFGGGRAAPAKIPRRSSKPARWLLFGYLAYMLAGWILLSLPFAHKTPVGAADDLFIAVSAVSTAGLSTIDIAGSYTLFGQIVIALMMQLGGIGYMTAGSFTLLAIRNRMSRTREDAARTAFALPDSIEPKAFIRSVILFTLACEAVGAIALYPFLAAAKVSAPAWSAIFHAISAFCTAGLSLQANSLEAFRGAVGVNLVIAVLCLLGAMGFIVVVDATKRLAGREREPGLASTVIVRVTLALIAGGTLLLFVIDPALAVLPPAERLMTAFFQVVVNSTTGGFDTVPLGTLSKASLLVLMFLMVVGASPAGTGGGIKTTTFAALLALVRSVQKGRASARLFGRSIPTAQLQIATATLTSYLLLLLAGLLVLFLTEPDAPFDAVLFEAISALSTVGTSLGLTHHLSTLGKLTMVVLMIAGRVGVLSFAIAASGSHRDGLEDDDNEMAL
ncbi:TrkH family potassium uptake protein [Jiella sp. M17.18]|uniref:TrkH family potassium uptake protein n=1 Tax=Jiella sp. M17.18 TaxID=3234247 RepID=UPI0034E025ED